MVQFGTFNAARRVVGVVTLLFRNTLGGRYSMHTNVQAASSTLDMASAAGVRQFVADAVVIAVAVLFVFLACGGGVRLQRGRPARTGRGGMRRDEELPMMQGLGDLGSTWASALAACIAGAQAAAACTLVAAMVQRNLLPDAGQPGREMHADIAAEARVTMPAKAGAFSMLREDIVKVAQLAASADVPMCPSGGAFAVWDMPLWARPDDNSGLNGMLRDKVRVPDHLNLAHLNHSLQA